MDLFINIKFYIKNYNIIFLLGKHISDLKELACVCVRERG